MKAIAILPLVMILSGCMCVAVSTQERAEIEALHARGISWSGEWKAGRFEPPVKMGPAVGWSFLPGASQVFMAHKMEVNNIVEVQRGASYIRLESKGMLMLGTSWLPYVYAFTFPFGLATGTVIDVNRINNLALLRQMKVKGEFEPPTNENTTEDERNADDGE